MTVLAPGDRNNRVTAKFIGGRQLTDILSAAICEETQK